MTEQSRMIHTGIVFSMMPVVAVLAYLGWQISRETSPGWQVFNIFIFTLASCAILLVFVIKLKLRIRPDELEIRYFPFKRFHIPKAGIRHVSVIRINSLREFGGWGLRKSKVFGTGYTTQGDWILRLEKLDGSVISVSIFDTKAVSDALSRYGYPVTEVISSPCN